MLLFPLFESTLRTYVACCARSPTAAAVSAERRSVVAAKAATHLESLTRFMGDHCRLRGNSSRFQAAPQGPKPQDCHPLPSLPAGPPDRRPSDEGIPMARP